MGGMGRARWDRAGIALVAIVLFALIAGTWSRASHAVLPDWLTTEISHIAEAYSQSGEDAGLEPDNAELQADLNWRIQRDSLSALVVTSIAELPGQAGEIVAAAVFAVPDFRDTVVRDALIAYPSFSQTIRAAAATPKQFLIQPIDDVRVVVPNTQFIDEGARPAGADETSRFDDPYADDFGDDFLDDEFDDLLSADAIDDPLEDFNRAIFWFNDIMDQAIIRPIAWTYGYITPAFIKEPVRLGFRNLGAPVRLINEIGRAHV